MYILQELEFYSLSKRNSVKWKEITDSQIKLGKTYLISDKQFEYEGHPINVVEKLDGRMRVVSTRRVRKSSPYIYFDVASDMTKKGQKQLLLHRARKITFDGEDPEKPIVRHGSKGVGCNDLSNLEWGTHADNMEDAKMAGSHKGEKNAASKNQ